MDLLHINPAADQSAFDESCNNSLLLEDSERQLAELNSSAFTFAMQHNSILAETSPFQLHINEANELEELLESNSTSTLIAAATVAVAPSSTSSQTQPSHATTTSSTASYETCQYCLRQFFVGRLQLHQKSCKPSKPLKPLSILKILNINSEFSEPQKSSNYVVSAPRVRKGEHPEVSANGKQSVTLAPSKSSLRLSVSPNTASLYEQATIPDNEGTYIEGGGPTSQQLSKQSLIEGGRARQSLSVISKVSELITKSYVQCSYCLRRFKPKIAEQHIPACKNVSHRPKPPKSTLQSRLQIGVVDTDTQQTSHATLMTPHSRGDNLISRESFESESTTATRSTVLSKSRSSLQLSKNSNNFEEKQITIFSSKRPIHHPQLQQQHQFQSQQTTMGSNTPDEEIQLLQSPSCLKRDPSSVCVLPSILENAQATYVKSIGAGGGGGKNNFQSASILQTAQQMKSYEDIISRSQKYSQVECPHCSRKFAKHAATRHIPICKNIENRPAKLMRRSQISYSQLMVGQKEFTDDDTTTAHIGNHQQDRQGQAQQIHFCTNCGCNLNDTFKYCGTCGKKRAK